MVKSFPPCSRRLRLWVIGSSLAIRFLLLSLSKRKNVPRGKAGWECRL